MPYRKRKSPLRGIGVAVGAMCPIAPNVVWALDFQFDQTSDGRILKLLNVIDEYSRECLAIDVERSIDADGVVRCLERLACERGAPAYVRFDHGPEFIAYAVADWCRFNGTDTVFIDPGSPWQNAWIESFNGRLRDEFLNGQRFETLLEAKVLIEDWRIDYNMNRPHSAHGWLTPVEFVEAWLNQQQLCSHSEWINNRGPLSVRPRGPARPSLVPRSGRPGDRKLLSSRPPRRSRRALPCRAAARSPAGTAPGRRPRRDWLCPTPTAPAREWRLGNSRLSVSSRL